MRATETIKLIPVLAFAALAVPAGGCVAAAIDEELAGEQLDITAEQCEEVDWPPNCPKYEEMSDSELAPKCDRKWMEDKQGRDQWKPDRPVCFGFGKNIDKCENCNRLQINDYSRCKNQLFTECAKRGKLPGQGEDNPPCPVTPPDDVKWPPPGDSGAGPGPTTQEYCDLGPPTAEEVAACRERAECS